MIEYFNDVLSLAEQEDTIYKSNDKIDLKRQKSGKISDFDESMSNDYDS